MPVTERVQVFESSSPAYHKAFQTFLEHTDQKTQAKQWLEAQVRQLANRRLFIDAGAGNGKVTAWFTPKFKRTIAMEPNPSLRKELTAVCPQAEILPGTILEAEVHEKADFILSSHVFYYIPAEEWMANLDRLVSWLAPQGTLVVIIQNTGSDCMKMLRHFQNYAFDLNPLKKSFAEKKPSDVQVSLEQIPSHITAPDLDTAYAVAEFMLNLLPLKDPSAAADVREYVAGHFKRPEGGFRFSCTQDCLKISRQ